VTSEPRFAHASEAELARILDYYGVAWQYEPRTFPIQWNPDGKVVESFSPDFYLPELELYVELTTLKQSLVRRKNRKLRRLRELYPDVRVKLFYGKDFRALMLKYGRVDLVASLSGLEGQIMPGPAAVTVLEVEDVALPITPAEPAVVARPSRPRVSRGSRRRRGRRAYLAARSAA
jgi:hypoxanthine phosphoribosyltransferase